MTIEELERQVLGLSAETQAELVGRLLRSFENGAKLDHEVAEAWTDEASKRDEEMTNGEDSGTPAEEVFDELRRREG